MRLDGMRDRAAALKSYAETYSLSSVESDARDGVEGENIASNVSSAFNFRALDDANRELTIRETAWEQLNTFQSISTEWMHSAIVDVNVDSVLEKIEKTKVQLGKLKRILRHKLKIQIGQFSEKLIFSSFKKHGKKIVKVCLLYS